MFDYVRMYFIAPNASSCVWRTVIIFHLEFSLTFFFYYLDLKSIFMREHESIIHSSDRRAYVYIESRMHYNGKENVSVFRCLSAQYTHTHTQYRYVYMGTHKKSIITVSKTIPI